MMKNKSKDGKLYVMFGIIALFLLTLVLPSVSAQIAVESSTVEPEIAYPGEEVNLKLSIENVGEDDIENVVVALDLSTVPFAPVGSSTEKVIDKIKDNDDELISFDLTVLPIADALIYKIPLTITYGTVSKTSLIAVPVSAQTHLDLLLDSNDILTIGTQGKVSFKFVNNGQVNVDFLKVTLKNSPLYEIISPAAVYIGDVTVGDFETEEFIILPLVKNPIVSLELEYKDTDGKQYREPKLIQLPTYTLEEATQKGLIAPKGTSPLLIILVIVGVIAVIMLYRRRRKKKQ